MGLTPSARPPHRATSQFKVKYHYPGESHYSRLNTQMSSLWFLNAVHCFRHGEKCIPVPTKGDCWCYKLTDTLRMKWSRLLTQQLGSKCDGRHASRATVSWDLLGAFKQEERRVPGWNGNYLLSYGVLRGKKRLKNQPLGLSFLLGRNYLHLNWKRATS